MSCYNNRWDGQGGYDRSRGNRRNWYFPFTLTSYSVRLAVHIASLVS